MEKFNITVPKTYTTKTGEEKTYWGPVGSLTKFTKDDGTESYALDLNMFPDTKFGVFKKEDRAESNDTASDSTPF